MNSVLLLNASYEPLTTIARRRALVLIVVELAEILEEHATIPPAKSAGGLEIPSPSVIRLLTQRPWSLNRIQTTPPLTRRRVFTRDNWVCQVVGCESTNVTLDHIHPTSKGGKNTWGNLISMCKEHNQKKGDSSLKELNWTLKKTPTTPRGFMMNVPAERPEWADYIEPFQKDEVIYGG